MELNINSRKLNKIITFSRPGEHYIYVDLNDKPGTLGNQICDGGEIIGSTIGYSGDNLEVFEKICHKWWKKFLQYNVQYYIEETEI